MQSGECISEFLDVTCADSVYFSAVVRQAEDGRLSQEINDALDGAALDGESCILSVIITLSLPNPVGASSGTVVLLGKWMKSSSCMFRLPLT